MRGEASQFFDVGELKRFFVPLSFPLFTISLEQNCLDYRHIFCQFLCSMGMLSSSGSHSVRGSQAKLPRMPLGHGR